MLLKIAADGGIAYDLDAHLHAEGLDLDFAPTIPADANRIRWLRADGSVAAEEYASGIQAAADAALQLIAYTVLGSTKPAIALLRASGSQNAQVLAHTGHPGDSPLAWVEATAGTTRRIVDTDGKSDFLQLAATSDGPTGRALFEQVANKGAANGYAGLDAGALVPLGNLPAIDSAHIADGTIVDADVAAGAAIAKSKLAALGIVNADVAAGAAIAYAKLALAGAIVNADIAAAAGILGSKVQWSSGAAPPANPATGDLWLLPADAANGVNWVFRYNAGSASASKWEFVGGPPVVVDIETQEATASLVYVDLATVGPSFTIPRAGDYLVEFGFFASNNTALDGFLAAPKIGAAATADADDAGGISATANASFYPSRSLVKTFAAADVCKLQYRAFTGGTATFSKRFLKITPRRVS
jgi:hypothetical protein